MNIEYGTLAVFSRPLDRLSVGQTKMFIIYNMVVK